MILRKSLRNRLARLAILALPALFVTGLLVAINASRADEPAPGSPEALLESMEKALTMDLKEEQDVEKIRAALQKTLAGIIVTADKVITHPKATAEQKTEAWRFKVSSIYQQALAEVPGSEKKLETISKTLKSKKETKEIASLAGYLLIRAKYESETGLTEKAMPAIDDYMKQFPGDDGAIALLEEIGITAELRGENKLAIKAFSKIKENFAKHPAALRVEGVLRRLNLVGSKMQLSGPGLDGKKIDLATYKNKVVLVDYWATWCRPCIADMPHVKDAYKKYHDKGFEVIGIPLDDNAEGIKKFVKQAGLPWKQIYFDVDGKRGFNHPAAVYYGVNAIPSTMLIGKDGKVIDVRVVGAELETLVTKALGIEPIPSEENEKSAKVETGTGSMK